MRCGAQVVLESKVSNKIDGDVVKVSNRLAADRCDQALRCCCIAAAVITVVMMMMIGEKTLKGGGICIDHGGCMMMQHSIDDGAESRGALGQLLLIHAAIFPVSS